MASGLSAEKVLTTTRGVRRRLDLTRPVERQLLVDCTRVAQQAPTGRNRQRWDFLFVTDPERVPTWPSYGGSDWLIRPATMTRPPVAKTSTAPNGRPSPAVSITW